MLAPRGAAALLRRGPACSCRLAAAAARPFSLASPAASPRTPTARTPTALASQVQWRFQSTQARSQAEPLVVEGTSYPRDEYTNATPTILSKLPHRLHLQPSHPIGILRKQIEAHFSSFEHLNSISPIVTVQQNFDDLGFPPDHPGRALTDSYYLNKQHMLRTHTSAHEVESFRKGLNQFLLSADVYRRDEIDRSHYPVFHQMEGCNVVDPAQGGIERLERENADMRSALQRANIVIDDPTGDETATNPYQSEHDPRVARIIAEHLKNSLNGLVLRLFGPNADKQGEPLQVRWIEATFPWTAPSYEVEVLFNGKWLEILGCGVVRQEALARSGAFSFVSGTPVSLEMLTRLDEYLLARTGVSHKQGWAFGLGLERIAMVLFSIPDIRLFWSQDDRFLSQFREGEISTFKPYSKYPECYKDLAFWLPERAGEEAVGKAWHENDFMEVVRDEAGDLVEGVQLVSVLSRCIPCVIRPAGDCA